MAWLNCKPKPSRKTCPDFKGIATHMIDEHLVDSMVERPALTLKGLRLLLLFITKDTFRSKDLP